MEWNFLVGRIWPVFHGKLGLHPLRFYAVLFGFFEATFSYKYLSLSKL